MSTAFFSKLNNSKLWRGWKGNNPQFTSYRIKLYEVSNGGLIDVRHDIILEILSSIHYILSVMGFYEQRLVQRLRERESLSSLLM